MVSKLPAEAAHPDHAKLRKASWKDHLSQEEGNGFETLDASSASVTMLARFHILELLRIHE